MGVLFKAVSGTDKGCGHEEVYGKFDLPDRWSIKNIAYRHLMNNRQGCQQDRDGAEIAGDIAQPVDDDS